MTLATGIQHGKSQQSVFVYLQRQDDCPYVHVILIKLSIIITQHTQATTAEQNRCP